MPLLPIEGGRVITVATFYKVSKKLDSGRFSEVYEAFDTHHQADVALKLYTGFDLNAHELAQNEVSVLTRLGELNCEYFPRLRRSAKHRIQNQNHPLLVLELGAYAGADGQKWVLSLNDVIPETGTTISKEEPDADFWAGDSLIRWVTHMVQAVKELHSAGIVHRDLKPANILLKRGAGQSEAVPFILDFNIAAASPDSDRRGGTIRYLPPEVTTGRRQAPSPVDDLWAIAMVAWELIYGQGASPEFPCSPHGRVTGSIPNAFVDALRRALCLNPESRFPNANEFLQALEAAAAPPVPADAAPVLTSNEVMQARTAMARIRRVIGEAISPPGEIFIPKEIHDAVTTAIAWLLQEETQSLNLVDEIARLGPVAVPVCLQQGYRLKRDSTSYNELVMAIAKLGALDQKLAQRSVDLHALSSNIGVRRLCWRVCEALEYFPEILLDSLTGDEGVLLPEERLRIAELCIRFCKDRSAVLALDKYLCREYILDPNRYNELSVLARRMTELKFPQTALLIAEDSQNCIWQELKEFAKVPAGYLEDLERGVIELMADAFAATGDAGLEVLKGGKLKRTAGERALPLFRRFATKLGRRNPQARSWLIKEASLHPGDPDLQEVVQKLATRASEGRDSPVTLLHEYLHTGSRGAFNKLRFSKSAQVLDPVGECLSSLVCRPN
jgi:hypothetical protein